MGYPLYVSSFSDLAAFNIFGFFILSTMYLEVFLFESIFTGTFWASWALVIALLNSGTFLAMIALTIVSPSNLPSYFSGTPVFILEHLDLFLAAFILLPRVSAEI